MKAITLTQYLFLIMNESFCKQAYFVYHIESVFFSAFLIEVYET
ncbi:hypothetical protein QSI_4282 [Clostridioides difficile P28]|nr:hypothetical protein QSI_4282 [Clostridioides difficile P28]